MADKEGLIDTKEDGKGQDIITRFLDKLYVHPSTLECAIKHQCRPCAYKLVVHSRPGLLPNQRPECCPRHISHTQTNSGSKLPASGSADGVIGLYDASRIKRVLTLGDGNFSYSLALARALAPHGVEVIATSHESQESVLNTYPDAGQILEELRALENVRVAHDTDATNSDHLKSFGPVDRVIWNFPCIRMPRGADGQNQEMETNKQLLRDFFSNYGFKSTLQNILTDQGQLHITHKTKPPFQHWGIESLADEGGLDLHQSVVFDRCMYPGYSNKKVLDKKSFPIWDSQTFIFIPKGRRNTTDHPKLVKVTAEMLEEIYELLQPHSHPQQKPSKKRKRQQANDKRAKAYRK